MTARKIGRIAFIGAGPGDPGLLTVRAHASLLAADVVVTDPDVPASITAAAIGAEIQPAVGEPAEVAKVLAAAARAGSIVVRLTSGDVLTADPVIKEIQAVAKTVIPFEIVPGLSSLTAAASYAGIALGSVHTVADVRSTKWETIAGAPGTLLLQASGGHLADTAAALAESGLASETPVSVTSGATLPTQRTFDATLATLDGVGRDLPGSLIITIGGSASQREKLSWWESRALYGWRVLIPQTKDGAEDLVTRLHGHGATSERVPTIAVEPPRTPAQMERAIKGLVDGRYQWIVFTSENSVKAVWDKFTDFGLDARAFSGVRIACVDEKTAAAVRVLGISADLVPDHTVAGPTSSAELLDEFPEFDDLLDPVDRVLLPRADIATDTLAAGVRERGWELDDVTAYRTVRAAPPPAPVREAIKTGGFEAVCFTSSSTVRNLVGIAGKPHARTVVACLGPKTAETAREFGLHVDVQPETPEIGALVEALAAHAQTLRAQGSLPPPRKTSRRR